MFLFDKNSYEINEGDVDNLIQLGSTEIKILEYKRILPGEKDSDKKEFLFDVASFANASGGLLIFGIEEKYGKPIRKAGITEDNQDSVILRLEQLIQSGIQPRIPGVMISSLLLSDNTYIYIIKIPQSWCGPHMVVFQGSSRFYSRNSAGKYLLDVNEIRQGFLGAEGLTNKVKGFHDERIGKIVANETPIQLKRGAKIVMHFIPLTSFQKIGNFINVGSIAKGVRNFETLSGTSNRSRINLDGVVYYFSESEESNLSYTQVFRNGIIELVDQDILDKRHDEMLYFPISHIEERVLLVSKNSIDFLQTILVNAPYIIFVSFIEIRGYRFALSGQSLRARRFYNNSNNFPIERNMINCPEILLEMNPVKNLEFDFREIFDVIWNAGGFEKSLSYDENGVWHPGS